MEDDLGVVTTSCRSEWSLVSDRNSVYYLKQGSIVSKGVELYLKIWMTSLLNVPESLQSKNPYPLEKHGRT